MNYTYHKKKHPTDVRVYIEEFNKAEGLVVFDFFDSNEYNLFTSINNFESGLSKPTMVVLKNYHKKNIQENTIYSIKQETIEAWNSQNLISIENNSFLLGFTIELEPNETEIFSESLTLNDFFDYNLFYEMPGSSDIEKIPFSLKGKLSVTIRRVGQGNWNEINVDNEIKYVYDAGASMYATKNEIIDIIGNRNIMYASSKPGLFLSHWDKDHYHSLIGMTDRELSNFSFFVCRSYAPNLTSRILFSRINNVIGNNNTFTIPAEPRNSIGGATYLIPITPLNCQLVVYNAQYNKNRNKSGIVLSVKTASSSIVLPGDVHYDQITRDILPHLNYFHIHNLVVPHHGGNAGAYIYKLPNKAKPGNAVISVGANHYGHPMSQYINALLSDKYRVLQTRSASNDIIINL